MVISDKNKILLLIPAYNAAGFLPGLIADIREVVPRIDILVVNDGSTDDTASVLEKSAINFICHKCNLGKGAALQSGFNYAIEKSYDYVITMDADRQHLPDEIPHFIEQTGKAELYLGTRDFRKGKMPFHRRLSNRLTSWCISCLIKKRIRDSQCGFRMIALDLIKRLDIESSGFQFESELVIQAGRLKATIMEIPVSIIYKDESSKMNHIMDTLKFIKLIWRYLWQ